jgi:hypothetical protein
MNQRTFIVYRRTGDQVTPYVGQLRGRAGGRQFVQIGAPVSWADLYGGHCSWVGEQLAKRAAAIKAERARRTARAVAP